MFFIKTFKINEEQDSKTKNPSSLKYWKKVKLNLKLFKTSWNEKQNKNRQCSICSKSSSHTKHSQANHQFYVPHHTRLTALIILNRKFNRWGDCEVNLRCSSQQPPSIQYTVCQMQSALAVNRTHHIGSTMCARHRYVTNYVKACNVKTNIVSTSQLFTLRFSTLLGWSQNLQLQVQHFNP